MKLSDLLEAVLPENPDLPIDEIEVQLFAHDPALSKNYRLDDWPRIIDRPEDAQIMNEESEPYGFDLYIYVKP